jgi:hypothetical protein
MKVEFEADFKDFAEINYLAWKQYSTSERIFPYLYIYLLFPAICSIPVLIFVEENWWSAVLTFFLVFLASLYFFRFPTHHKTLTEFAKVLGKNKTYLVEIEFSEDGIRTSQLGNQYLYGWQNIVSILENKERLCFFTREKMGVSIPRRAIISTNEYANFIAFAKSRMSQELSS